MGLQKNAAGQKWRVFAFNKTNGNALTGDAANITAKIAKEWAAAVATNDVNPTETEDGYYNFDLTQAETNADALDLFPESSTANIQVIGVPGSQGTRVVQTGDSFARLGAPAGASVSADVADVDADTSELQSVLSAAILARTNNPNLNALLGVADTAGEDVPGQTAFEVADEVYTGATHNVTNSLAKRIRQQQEAGTYSLGAIWIDTVNGTPGTTNFDNGVFLKPVDTIADANTIAASLNIARFVLGSGSAITFAAAQTNQIFTSQNWTLALGGQNIGGTHISGAEVSGVSTGVPSLDHCHLNICTFAGGEFTDCALQDAITLSGAVPYSFINCYHAEAGAPSTIDFGAAVGATEVHIHNWHGNLTILNMKAGDILHFTCADGALTMDSTCTGGTRNSAGNFGLTDNSSGMTVNDLGQMYQRIGAPVGVDISADIAAIPTTAMRGTDGANTTTPLTAAEVLTQVNAALDAAIAELSQAQPAATPSIRTGIMLLYMALRNRFDTQTSGTDALEIYNDAGTLIAKKLITDDDADYSEAKMVAGP